MSDEQKKWDAKLISSATLSNLEGVKKAFEEGANPNAADDNGWTALYWALTQSSATIEVVKFLLEDGRNESCSRWERTERRLWTRRASSVQTPKRWRKDAKKWRDIFRLLQEGK